MDDLEKLAEEIDRDATAVAFTGAGISAPSGVPTFRGDDGVWKKFDEGQFAYGRFQRDPKGFWDDRIDLQRELFGREYEPNAAHEALASMGQDGQLEAILTQNTDGLHADAFESVTDETSSRDDAAVMDDSTVTDDAAIGASNPTLLELHGNSKRVRCIDCGKRTNGDPIFERAADGELPPTCDCGGVYKPDVVLFGEQLPGAVIQQARTLARESDIFLAIGSSLVVEPAASLPRIAASNDATVGIVNLESTPVDESAEVVIREDVTDVLPRLRSLVDGEY